jgi:phage terminase large subunit
MERRDRELLVAGPAGTGKTRACLEKLHAMALLNPGMQGLIVRKTAASLSASGLQTWRRFVIPDADSVVTFYGGSAEQPPQYRYVNGSRIVIGGMDKATKIMSTEYDIIFVQEATELTENDWESLTTRLRSNVVSFQQLLADCNPDRDTHWLKARCDRDQTVMLRSRHEDNPLLFDDNGHLTPAGADYIAALDALTGVRYLRLRKGEWSSAEGIIYEDWETAVHLIDRFPIPDDWRRFWAVDFGFTNPMVIQRWAEDPDGRLFMYREHYMTGRTVDQHAADVIADVTDGQGRWTEPKPVAVVCDHDAEGREVFARETGLHTTKADKQVSAGIEAVMRRLKDPGVGTRRLHILRDSLAERDPSLERAGRPTCTADEIPGYVWDVTQGKAPKEAPVKEDDHGVDAMRYVVMHVESGYQVRAWEPTPIVRGR